MKTSDAIAKKYDFSKPHRMDPEVKRLFVVALRSGNYNKTIGCLHYKTPDIEGFCAMGVLADVLIKNGLTDYYWAKETYEHRIAGALCLKRKGTRFVCFTTIPDTMRGVAKLSIQNMERIIDRNDVFDYHFDEIADCVEAEL